MATTAYTIQAVQGQTQGIFDPSLTAEDDDIQAVQGQTQYIPVSVGAAAGISSVQLEHRSMRGASRGIMRGAA